MFTEWCNLQPRQSTTHSYSPLAEKEGLQIPPRPSSLLRSTICRWTLIEESTCSWPQTNIVSKSESFNPEWWDMGDGEKLKAIPGSGERSIQTTRGRTVSPCPPTSSPAKCCSQSNILPNSFHSSYEIYWNRKPQLLKHVSDMKPPSLNNLHVNTAHISEWITYQSPPNLIKISVFWDVTPCGLVYR